MSAARPSGGTPPCLGLSSPGIALFAGGRLDQCNGRLAELLDVAGDVLTPGAASADVFARAGLGAEPGAGPRRLLRAGRTVDVRYETLSGGTAVLTARDVSALAEAQLESAEHMKVLEAAVASFPHGVLVFDPARRVAMVNPAYNRIFAGAGIEVGETRDGIVARRQSLGEYGPGDLETVVAQVALRSGERHDAGLSQLRRRRPNGHIVDILLAELPDGGMLHVATEVTEQVVAQEALMRAAGDMKAMLAGIRHGIVLWNRQGEVVACNPVAEALLQTKPGLLRPGRTLREVVHSAAERGNLGAEPERTRRIHALMAQDRRQSHSERRVTTGGQVLEVQSDPVAGGGFVTTYTDVTDAHGAEQELTAAKLAAEAADRAKSRFLAAISHELRTPLSQVVGFSEELTRLARQEGPGGPDLAEIAHCATAVQDAGLALFGLIEDMLDVAGLDGREAAVLSDRVSLSAVAVACVRRAESPALAGGVALRTSLPDGLPWLQGDERRIRNAIQHLLSNAVKFTEAGGSVCVSAGMDDAGGLRLLVSDTGIGIPANDQQRIYEPFTQLDASLSRRFAGAGLGLTVTRAVMGAHGGTVLIDSAPGQGTRATVVFPPERVLSPPFHKDIT